jgi:replicative DNA helicase
MPVKPGERVLYIAADRPTQARRSLARMVDESHRTLLDERLVVHVGPPGFLAEDTQLLAKLARNAAADTIVVDSLKDVVAKLSDDEQALRTNHAFQAAIAAGAELVVLHHQRKASGDNKRPTKLDDVYGHLWLTAGLGSVLLLWGKPGAIAVDLDHLKQPAEPLGTTGRLELEHDHHAGRTIVAAKADLADIVYRAGAAGITASNAAGLLFKTDKPDRNEYNAARSRLERMADRGEISRVDDQPPRYVAIVGGQPTPDPGGLF